MEWAGEADLLKNWLLSTPMPGTSEAREELLNRAQRLIQRAYRAAGMTVDEALSSQQATAEDILGVQVQLAIQVLSNPRGASQLSENTGPFGGSITFGSGVTHRLVLTDEMYEELGLASFVTSRVTGTVPLWE